MQLSGKRTLKGSPKAAEGSPQVTTSRVSNRILDAGAWGGDGAFPSFSCSQPPAHGTPADPRGSAWLWRLGSGQLPVVSWYFFPCSFLKLQAKVLANADKSAFSMAALAVPGPFRCSSLSRLWAISSIAWTRAKICSESCMKALWRISLILSTIYYTRVNT